MAKVLVLGANGFIGSHLVDSLVDAGHTVRAFDRFSADGQTKFNTAPQVEVLAGDYLNLADLENALDDMEYVFHFISTTTPATAENDPLVDIETNIRMSVELFKLCAGHKSIKRLIFSSTGGSIYGDARASEAFKETDTPRPVSPYAIGKLTIEHYLRYFRVKHGLDSVSLRISNPYGERQPFNRKQGVIPIFLEHVAADLPLTVFGDGSMMRDYVYVKDLTDAICSMFDKDLKYSTYNVGSGSGTEVSELVEIARRVSGKQPEIKHADVPSTFVDKSVLDTDRFTSEFGAIQVKSLEAGMRATYDYITQEMRKNASN